MGTFPPMREDRHNPEEYLSSLLCLATDISCEWHLSRVCSTYLPKYSNPEFSQNYQGISLTWHGRFVLQSWKTLNYHILTCWPLDNNVMWSQQSFSLLHGQILCHKVSVTTFSRPLSSVLSLPFEPTSCLRSLHLHHTRTPQGHHLFLWSATHISHILRAAQRKKSNYVHWVFQQSSGDVCLHV